MGFFRASFSVAFAIVCIVLIQPVSGSDRKCVALTDGAGALGSTLDVQFDALLEQNLALHDQILSAIKNYDHLKQQLDALGVAEMRLLSTALSVVEHEDAEWVIHFERLYADPEEPLEVYRVGGRVRLIKPKDGDVYNLTLSDFEPGRWRSSSAPAERRAAPKVATNDFDSDALFARLGIVPKVNEPVPGPGRSTWHPLREPHPGEKAHHASREERNQQLRDRRLQRRAFREQLDQSQRARAANNDPDVVKNVKMDDGDRILFLDLESELRAVGAHLKFKKIRSSAAALQAEQLRVAELRRPTAGQIGRVEVIDDAQKIRAKLTELAPEVLAIIQAQQSRMISMSMDLRWERKARARILRVVVYRQTESPDFVYVLRIRKQLPIADASHSENSTTVSGASSTAQSPPAKAKTPALLQPASTDKLIKKLGRRSGQKSFRLFTWDEKGDQADGDLSIKRLTDDFERRAVQASQVVLDFAGIQRELLKNSESVLQTPPQALVKRLEVLRDRNGLNSLRLFSTERSIVEQNGIIQDQVGYELILSVRATADADLQFYRLDIYDPVITVSEQVKPREKIKGRPRGPRAALDYSKRVGGRSR